MKLTVEIIGEKISYDWVIGKSTQHGDSDLCPDALHAFSVMLRMCNDWHTQQYKEWMDMAKAKAYVEKNHPELLPLMEKKPLTP